MRATLLAAAMACGLATAAQASVTYTLTNPVYNQVALDAGVVLHPFSPVDITVSDAAVASGTFNLAGINNGANPTYTGDVASFVSFHGREMVTPGYLYGSFTASLSFAANGSITSGLLTFLGIGDELHFRGTSTSFGGTFGSDQYQGCGSGPDTSCQLTGQLAAVLVPNPVPEPVSMALLSGGLAALGLLRRPARRPVM